MFKKRVVRAFSIVAIVLSVLGLLFSVWGSFVSHEGSITFAFIMGLVSWAILLWASIIGFQLCSYYKLYEEYDEYKKIGIWIYLIIVAFILFFFVGLVVGLALAIIIFGALWARKANSDKLGSDDFTTNEADTTTNI